MIRFLIALAGTGALARFGDGPRRARWLGRGSSPGHSALQPLREEWRRRWEIRVLRCSYQRSAASERSRWRPVVALARWAGPAGAAGGAATLGLMAMGAAPTSRVVVGLLAAATVAVAAVWRTAAALTWGATVLGAAGVLTGSAPLLLLAASAGAGAVVLALREPLTGQALGVG